MDDDVRFQDVNRLLLRGTALASTKNFGTIFPEHVAFEPMPELLGFIREQVRVLVIGAGGLGCELLKDLALVGFGNIDVIDLDTIDVSNLNRQFLFRERDVGRPKAQVAAEFIMKRVSSVQVNWHHAKIQDMGAEFYRQFNIIVLGLDSIDARRWINAMACSLVTFQAGPDGALVPDLATMIPLIDGGTEGLKGHARVIYPRVNACFECTLDLFPPQTAVPLCTLAETPRNAAHCVLYAHLIQSGKEFQDNKPDTDDPTYQQWVYQQAQRRAEQFGISGVSLTQTQGVIKNIIPAIASTNAVISAMCATEALKIVTNCSAYLDNNTLYMGTEGLYAPSFSYDRNPACIACSGERLQMRVEASLQLKELIAAMKEDSRMRFKNPALRAEGGIRGDMLYLAAMADTAANLELRLSDLVHSGTTIIVTDSTLPTSTAVVVDFIGGD